MGCDVACDAVAWPGADAVRRGWEAARAGGVSTAARERIAIAA
jgi:hypothetical protein